MHRAPTQAPGYNLTQADNSASTASAESLVKNHLPGTTRRQKAESSSLQSTERSLSHRVSHTAVCCFMRGGTLVSAPAQ